MPGSAFVDGMGLAFITSAGVLFATAAVLLVAIPGVGSTAAAPDGHEEELEDDGVPTSSTPADRPALGVSCVVVDPAPRRPQRTKRRGSGRWRCARGRDPPNPAPGAVTNTGVVPSVQTLIRNARLVPVAGVPAPTDEPLDLRIVDGIVTDVAERLAPALDDEVFDAAGRWAAPGLWDHHVHMSQWADVASRLDMSGTHAPEEVVARVARHIDTLDPRDESVVSGYGHRTGTWTRLPTVAELDAVSGQHPVVLISGDAHHGWLNSAALSLLGVPPRQTTLDENDWFPVFGRLGDLPGAGLAHKLALREVVRDAAARGVVGVTDLEFGGAYLDWPERFAQGVDSLRVRAATYAEGLAEVVAAGLRTGDDLARPTGCWRWARSRSSRTAR